MRIKLFILILINIKLIVAKNEYNILELYDEVPYVYVNTIKTFDPNLLIKYDATGAANWTVGNEFVYEGLFRFNRVDFTNDPIYTFLSIEHGNDKFYFKAINSGEQIEIDLGENKVILNDYGIFTDRQWHNFIITYSRTLGYAQIAFDCKDTQRIQIIQEKRNDEEARKMPLLIGFPRTNIIHSLDIRKAKVLDKIGNRWEINCKDYEKFKRDHSEKYFFKKRS